MWCCTWLSTYVIDSSAKVWSMTCVLSFDFAGFLVNMVDCVKGFKLKYLANDSLVVVTTSVSFKDVMVVVVKS